MKRLFLVIGLLFMLVACSQAPRIASIDDMVGEIVKRAKADDTAFFAKYVDPSIKGQERKLIEQIKASGMMDNYKSRLEVSDSKARLNFHYLEKGCHFQIDLEKQNGSWLITRIWFCR